MTRRELIIEAARQIAERGDRTLAALLVAVCAADEAREERDERGRRLALVSAFQALAHELGYELGRDVMPVQPQDGPPRVLFIALGGEVVFAPAQFSIETGFSPALGYVVEVGMPGRSAVLADTLDGPQEAHRLRDRILDEIASQVRDGAGVPVIDVRTLLADVEEVEP